MGFLARNGVTALCRLNAAKAQTSGWPAIHPVATANATPLIESQSRF